MPRCSCAGSTCSCLITAGVGVNVTGLGTAADPYVVSTVIGDIAGSLAFNDSASIDFTVVGAGTPSDPLIVSASLIRQKFPIYATTGRPSATTWGEGSYYYDTTIDKPLWSNGSVWKDAAGATV